MIFANAMFDGRLKTKREIQNNKIIEIYIPKNQKRLAE
jgi:hypothetical protein